MQYCAFNPAVLVHTDTVDDMIYSNLRHPSFSRPTTANGCFSSRSANIDTVPVFESVLSDTWDQTAKGTLESS